jgi:hypothetical protein
VNWAGGAHVDGQGGSDYVQNPNDTEVWGRRRRRRVWENLPISVSAFPIS